MTSQSSAISSEVVKRLHLNLLIQGAAVDTSTSLDPDPDLRAENGMDLNPLSQRVGIGMQLSQMEARSFLLSGRTGGKPKHFWNAIDKPSHPFHNSRLLRDHARELADQTYETTRAQAITVGIAQKWDKTHDRQLLANIKELHVYESTRRNELAQLANNLASAQWGIPLGQLRGELRSDNSPGLMFSGQKRPTQWREALLSMCSAGWCRVVFDTPPRVEARAIVFPLLRHELAKGIAELATSHGLASLDDETYAAVVEATDLIYLERPGMQVGPSLFQRWTATLPPSISVATGLTHLSLAEPDIVETALIAVIEDPLAATEIMRHLCSASIIDLGEEAPES